MDDKVNMITKDATFGQIPKVGDTINVNFISDKSMLKTEKSDTARDYIVTKISKNGKTLDLETKQQIHQIDIENGEDEIVDEKVKVKLASDTSHLISTSEAGIWMLTQYVEAGKDTIKTRIEESDETDDSKKKK